MTSEYPEFDWRSAWLKGEEYAFILKNIDAYCHKFHLLKFPKKTHPQAIYTDPQSKTYISLYFSSFDYLNIKSSSLFFNLLSFLTMLFPYNTNSIYYS